jgi:hypothetical protein
MSSAIRPSTTVSVDPSVQLRVVLFHTPLANIVQDVVFFLYLLDNYIVGHISR